MASPDHDTLTVLIAGSGPKGVSFTKHAVPELAVLMDAHDDLVKTTSTAILQFISAN